MKKLLLFTLVLCTALIMQGQNYILMQEGGAFPMLTDPSDIYQDADGLIGIGTAAPTSKLDIVGGCDEAAVITATRTCGSPESAGDYFIARTRVLGPPPNYGISYQTDFIIKGDGKVGIGIAEPFADLTILTHGWDEGDFGKPVMLVFDDHDENDGNFIAGLLNTGTEDYPSGAF